MRCFNLKVRVRRPLLPDGPEGVHLRVLPAAVGVAAAEEPHHAGGVRGAPLRPITLLPLPTHLPQRQHEVRHAHRRHR